MSITLKSYRLSFQIDRGAKVQLETKTFDTSKPRIAMPCTPVFDGTNAVDAISTKFCPAAYGGRARVAACFIPSNATPELKESMITALNESILAQCRSITVNAGEDIEYLVNDVRQKLNAIDFNK